MSRPILFAGFDGWGNAMGVSKGIADYLVRKLEAHPFAYLAPDSFFRYDENRPLVNIEEGILQNVSIPGGTFYSARTPVGSRDIVVLTSDEPNLKWFQFVDELFDLCLQAGIDTVVTLGGMYDNVLHSERRISGIVSDNQTGSALRDLGVLPISYHGPSAIHAIIHSEGEAKGLSCISLWCHCPYYFQGSNHFGLMSFLGKVLASLGEFELDTSDLERNWNTMERQIEKLVAQNPEVQKIINDIRKSRKVEDSRSRPREVISQGKKVIDLKDFLEPK